MISYKYCAARNCNLVICPAMNTYMYMNLKTQEYRAIENDGVTFIGPVR